VFAVGRLVSIDRSVRSSLNMLLSNQTNTDGRNISGNMFYITHNTHLADRMVAVVVLVVEVFR
jgi:hypothetical protein